ncbi:MAG: hypothetical protein PGN30_10055 [Mycolicibacterium neoaurum]|uniref:hypothetical protein n=1 Tax=Mycolicibacterium neoaurum TaxID=1795 RepID=UPI002FFBBF94
MVGLIAWIVTAVIVTEWFWWIVGALAAVWVYWRVRVSQAERAHRRRALAARADLQHAWALAGDVRGTFGDYPPADLSGTVR